MSKIAQIWKAKDLRNRILMVAALLIVTRILAHIPIPGIEISNLKSLLSNNQLFGLFNIFSGGGLSNFSVAMLGVGPYITASIITQLLTIIIPKLYADTPRLSLIIDGLMCCHALELPYITILDFIPPSKIGFQTEYSEKTKELDFFKLLEIKTSRKKDNINIGKIKRNKFNKNFFIFKIGNK